MNTVRALAVVAAATVGLVLAGCGTESDVLGTGRSGISGRVVDKDTSAKPVLSFTLVIDDGQEQPTRLFVKRKVWRRCQTGDRYPACAGNTEGPAGGGA